MRPTISWSDLRAGPGGQDRGGLAAGQVGLWGLGVEGLANLAALVSLGRQPVLVDDHPPAGGVNGRAVLATSGDGLAALAGCDVVGTLEKYKHRIHFLDYKDSRWTTPTADVIQPNGARLRKDSEAARFFSSIYDLGDGQVDFPGCHRVLRSVDFRGWICVDLDTARKGPLASYQHCDEYITTNLEPIYI